MPESYKVSRQLILILISNINFENLRTLILFVGGIKDSIFPHGITIAIAGRYEDTDSKIDVIMFEVKNHLICVKACLKQQSGEDILLFGSPSTTHSLIQLNLIDGYWLFLNPIILGRGIPLFADIKDRIKLNLLTTRQFSCGVTELNYKVDRQ